MLNLAVFVSGRGSNLKALHQAVVDGKLDARIVLVVASSEKVAAIDWASSENIRVFVPSTGDPEADQAELLDVLRESGANFIALAGYLKRIPASIISAFHHRIVNIHPALLPSFGGKGMYGRHVHEAVLASGVKVSGATVHIVDEVYDHGSIVMQKAVEVQDDDTVESLAARVLAVEHSIFPEALQLFAAGRIRVEGQRTIRT